MTSASKELTVSESTTNQLLGSVEALFKDHADKLAGIKSISDFVHDKEELMNYFCLELNQYSLAKKLFDYDHAKASLDAEFWGRAIEMTDVLDCMSGDKRNEWNKNIHDRKCPSFERETVIGTIRNLLLSRDAFVAEKVDGIFRKLSGNHVTNSPLGFKKRMIIEYVLTRLGSSMSTNHQRIEYIADLRSVIAKLMNKDEPRSRSTQADIRRITEYEGEYGQWHEFDGGAFKIRVYKVGTAHLEVHPEIAAKLNLILATLHPYAIASGARTTTHREKTVPLYHDTLSLGVVNELNVIADHIRYKNCEVFLWDPSYDADAQTIEDTEKVLAFLGGKKENKVWAIPTAVTSALYKIIRMGRVPEKESHQFYPTQPDLAQRVADMVDAQPGDSILEPSAGQGALAELLPKESMTCVEISEVNCEVLKQKGFTVFTEDFLKWESTERFNKIVMNPPFTGGQAERHVRRAAELLKPNGALVAILPASLRNKMLVPDFKHNWSETITDAFLGTGVSVVILELTARRTP